ncbi:hypothetical protein AM588_10009939 [Phytophthora nicotianae]|uniref:PCI domain-containing protein n=1 Tax=Phytophthora nicotianae TaxID=4792 RepID=A0A0W8DJT4_PHYNI|nr:hypothetical protein AM588_10009939 [Phytophthora nicotianae]
MTTTQDVEMAEPEQVHPLQTQFEDAEDLAVDLTPSTSPNAAIEAFQSIISYGTTTRDIFYYYFVNIYLSLLCSWRGRDAGASAACEGALDLQAGAAVHPVRPREGAGVAAAGAPTVLRHTARAKTGKIVRTVIDMVAKVKVLDAEKALQLQADLCIDSIEWCKQEKHTFLRQRVEARLASIYFQQNKFQPALDLITELLHEIKKLDDKQLLVEIHLVESKLHHALRNVPKAKAALTAARSISNTIYVVPRTQAQIDQMSGILHAEERFEALATLDEVEGLKCLKYMLLAKVASGGASEVNLIINSKQAIKFIGVDLEAMQAVAKAHEQRSLEQFEAATKKYAPQLVEDPLIKNHLGKLYEQLLESNLIKIIQPFSLSQMILDHKFHGILDQGKGQLIKTYTSGLGVIENVGHIVDNLFRRADKLQA